MFYEVLCLGWRHSRVVAPLSHALRKSSIASSLVFYEVFVVVADAVELTLALSLFFLLQRTILPATLALSLHFVFRSGATLALSLTF